MGRRYVEVFQSNRAEYYSAIVSVSSRQDASVALHVLAKIREKKHLTFQCLLHLFLLLSSSSLNLDSNNNICHHSHAVGIVVFLVQKTTIQPLKAVYGHLQTPPLLKLMQCIIEEVGQHQPTMEGTSIGEAGEERSRSSSLASITGVVVEVAVGTVLRVAAEEEILQGSIRDTSA